MLFGAMSKSSKSPEHPYLGYCGTLRSRLGSVR